MKRTLYFGPPIGFYEPKRFNDFALIDIPRKLIEIGSQSECNPERSKGKGFASSANPEEGIIYHYPNAGIGISYQIVRTNRCMVDLMATRIKEMDEIMEFLFYSDNENYK